VIRQNRAVPILMVLTLAWVLYLGGCFGSEDPTASVETAVPTTVVATPSPAPVVTEAADTTLTAEKPFEHTIESGDLLGTIAAKYNVTPDVILRANPSLNPNTLIPGQTLRIPGATTLNTITEDREADRDAGLPIDYVIEDGDSLGQIALTWTVTIDSILEANPNANPNALQIGQLLVIPPFGTGYSPEELAAFSTPVPVTRQPGEILYHVVQPGDLLSALADVYSVSVDEIIGANGLANADNIAVGQELVIPAPSATTDN